MLRKLTFAAALLAATALTGMAHAKTLVYCSEASPAHFDPGPTTGGNDFDASSHTIYNRLVEFKDGTTDVEPALAESWTVSDDGLEITFKLRPGVKFQTLSYFTPTRDFNADDVIFSFERQYKTDNPYFAYLPNLTWDYYQGMDMPKYVKSIEKVDDLTVKFVLSEPNAPMIANLAMDFASIVSKEYADQLAAAGTPQLLSTQPVGTGPFQLVDYQLDAVIRYAAFPDYWGGKRKIDDLIFAITTDASVRAQKLKAGECDIMPYPAPADIEGLQEDPNLTVMEQEGLNIGYMSYNVTEAPFDNVKVRKALTMAINKPAIIEAVYQGAGQAAKNLIPPTMWSYDNAIADDTYDPEGAKKLLAEAGVTGLDHRPVGDAGFASLQSERPARRGNDPGRLGRGRRHGEHRQLRVDRVPRARQAEGPPGTVPDRLDRRQWRSGQLLRHAVLLLGHWRVQLLDMVQQGVRGPDPEGQDHSGPGRAHQALRTGAGGLQG